MNEAAPVPVHVVEVFLRLNPASLEELWYKVSIIAICQNKRISGNVLHLFLKLGPKQSLQSMVRKNLIYHAILSENKEVIQVLIQHFPWVLSERLAESNNEIPLHDCLNTSPPVLEAIVNAGISQDIDEIGGIFVENDRGETFFDKLIMSFTISSENDDNDSRAAKWKRLEVCLKFIYLEIRGSGEKNKIPSKIPFCCICFLPSRLIDEGLKVIQFDAQQSDIYYMIQLATTSNWTKRMQLRCCDYAKMIGMIVSLTTHEVNKRDDRKQPIWNQPLYYGAFKGLRWDRGLEEIFLSDVDALQIPDTGTNLLPFMAAACSSICHLDTIYQLLLRNPSVIK